MKTYKGNIVRWSVPAMGCICTCDEFFGEGFQNHPDGRSNV